MHSRCEQKAGTNFLPPPSAFAVGLRPFYFPPTPRPLQAMSLMLPHTSRNPAEDNTVEGRLASMSSAGYLPVAKSSAELGDVLDRIKVGWVGGWAGRAQVGKVSCAQMCSYGPSFAPGTFLSTAGLL